MVGELRAAAPGPDDDRTKVLVVGASGFVGAAVCDALRSRQVDLRTHAAPRVAPASPDDLDAVAARTTVPPALVAALGWADVVVNCAGVAQASATDESALLAANAGTAVVLATEARRQGVTRFVHVSSAAVQGARATLDASPETSTFSPYSRSKARGERLVADLEWPAAVVYRPGGVHGADRAVTRTLVRLARSRASSVAAPGDWPTAQDLVENVADAAAFLAVSADAPPAIVHHPRGELTAGRLLEVLGDRRPLRVPRPVARGLVALATAVGRRRPGVAAQARRLETMWFGQDVADSWLTQHGWQRPVGGDGWERLGRALR